MSIVCFDNVSVYYDKKPALENIHLNIQKHEHSVILGANGSGKSTLIKLFSNDLHPIFKKNMVKKIFNQDDWNIQGLKSQMGIITNDLHIEFCQQAAGQTGWELVASGFFSSLGKFFHHEPEYWQIEKTKQVMQFLNMEHLQNKTVAQMSTGEIRKCIIGRALVHEPKSILLDEPTVGLDIKARFEFLQILQELSKSVTIILITHHLEEIFPQIKKVILLKNGKIFKEGNKHEVLTSENLTNVFSIPIRVIEKNGFYSAELLSNHEL